MKHAEKFIEKIKFVHLKVHEKFKEIQAKYKIQHDKHHIDYKF